MSKRFKSYFQFAVSISIVVVVILVVGRYGRSTADSSNLKIDFLNVGQGDAEYIRTPSGQDILIDGGPDNSVLNQLGEVTSGADHEINLVILSHPHTDHLTGLVEVLRRYKVGEVWETGVAYPSATYDEFHNLILKNKIPRRIIKAGDGENFDSIKLTVLYPLSPLENKTIDNLNNASDVIRLDYQNFSALFTGDLEKDAQKNIIASGATALHATVLKVPHHGSNNGIDENFLKIIRPALAIIEVGKSNSYGHPHAATLNFLRDLAIKYYRTDQDGRVEVISNGQNYSVEIFSN